VDKLKFEILKKGLNIVSLVSLTSQNWYDENGDIISWNENGTYIGPNEGDIIFNVSGGTVTSGYYKWNTPLENTWNLIETSPTKLSDETNIEYYNRVLSRNFDDFHLPLFLQNTVDEMGVMVGFDGDIEQVEQLCNFSYSGTTGSTEITIYNTVNPDRLRKIVEQEYTIDWGDGDTDTISVVTGATLPSASHTYISGDTYNVTLTLNAPWITQKVTKSIKVPFDYSVDSYLGTFTYTGTSLPYYNIPDEYYLESGRTQNYLNDVEYNPPTGYTQDVFNNAYGSYTGFTYLGIGGSRIEEKRKYGSTSYSDDVTTGTTTFDTGEVLSYNEYSFTITGTPLTTTIITYRDYEDGTTFITGNTSGFTKEEVINQSITRNEHFLGFVDDPTIYSDIFVERGKQGVLEKTLRLGEVDNMGELSLYGNGYFKVRKQ
jgi:hypothetical protein